jgi:hypothetical protein
MNALKLKPDDVTCKDKSFNNFRRIYPHHYSTMAIPAPSWTSVRKLLINNGSSLPDLYFARRFCILVVISAFITSQGDFTTTQRIVNGLSSIVGINQKTRWKYLSIMLWKASEFGIGWWLDCTGTVHKNPRSLIVTEIAIQVRKLHLLHYCAIFPSLMFLLQHPLPPASARC